MVIAIKRQVSSSNTKYYYFLLLCVHRAFFYEAKTTLQVSLTNTAEARLKINQLKKEES